MRFVSRVILVLAATLVACQMRGMGLISSSGEPFGLVNVRNSLSMTEHDSVVGTHRIIVSGEYIGPNGKGTFRRVYEPNGNFEHHTRPTDLDESVHRFDGEVLWVEAEGGDSYPMTQSRARLACSVEWILSSRWLTAEPSPFQAKTRTSARPASLPGFELHLTDGGPESMVWLDPVSYQPRTLTIARRRGPVVMQMSDWRTRRGFAWPHQIRIDKPDGTSTRMTTMEVLFEPSVATINANKNKRTRMIGVSFDEVGNHTVTVKRSTSGHMLVRPKLLGKEIGWFLVDTGTGVNCVDPVALERVPGFLPTDANSGRDISVIGLGGRVQSKIRKGGDFTLGSMRAKNMEWIELDLTDLHEVVGVKLAGVLGGEFFQRAVVEIDLRDGTLDLHDPRTFDASRLPWRSLRFDGSTPCVQARFAPSHEGWFRLDTGSDDTVTFHSPWVRKLRLVDKATQLIPMRLKGIGGEIKAVRGRIRWFELMGQRFHKPKVTMVERATGPLANPDLYGNIGVGFFTGQRLILDYPGHRVALIPR